MLRNVLSSSISSVISGVIGGSGIQSGPLPAVQSLYYPEPIGGSTATKRYLWHLDGQDDFWDRGSADYGATTTAILEATFLGSSSTTGFQIIVGRSGADRFYIAHSNGVIRFGNGNTGTGTVVPIVGELNHAILETDGVTLIGTVNGVEVFNQAQNWSGVLDDVGFGLDLIGMTSFYDSAISAFRVATDSVDDVYKLDSDGDFEDAIGREGDLTSRLTRQNGEPSGSDIELITRKSDNSGWIGVNQWSGVLYDDPVIASGESGFAQLSGENFADLPIGVNYACTGDFDVTQGSILLTVGGSNIFNNVGSGSFDQILNSTFGLRLIAESGSGVSFGSMSNIKVIPTYDYAAGAND